MDNNFDFNNNTNNTENGFGYTPNNEQNTNPYTVSQSNASDSVPQYSSAYTYNAQQSDSACQSSGFAVAEIPQSNSEYNPYISSAQYSVSDFGDSGKKSKKKSGKKGIMAVAAICAALIISGGSFYAGVSYFDKNDGSAESAVATTNTVVSNANTVATSSDSTEVSSTITQVVEEAMPSMVAINTITQTSMGDTYGYFYNFIFGDDYNQTYETSASGSGIIIGQNDEELLIVTNNHVIEDSTEIAVEFIDGESYDATIKGTSADNDLAVISVKIADMSADTLSKIKIAVLGDSTTLKLGEPAIAIGNSLGYGQSVTVGYISATERTVQLSDKTMTLLQTDAAINPGNSGGALLNIKGEVIGINSAKYSDTSVEGTGYAIPISDAAPIINDLMNSTYVADEDKPYLGIYGQSVPTSYQERFDWPAGVYVSQVTAGSPASLAGLQAGDIITALDGEAVETMEELQALLEKHSVGDKVELSVTRSERNGKVEEGTLTATLIARGDVEGALE